MTHCSLFASANEKRHPPKLDDDVYRLEEISKDGIYHKRLQKAQIFKVQEFLKAINKDANKLREEVINLPPIFFSPFAAVVLFYHHHG